ncbi:mCG145553, partial [Mus musculus]
VRRQVTEKEMTDRRWKKDGANERPVVNGGGLLVKELLGEDSQPGRQTT